MGDVAALLRYLRFRDAFLDFKLALRDFSSAAAAALPGEVARHSIGPYRPLSAGPDSPAAEGGRCKPAP